MDEHSEREREIREAMTRATTLLGEVLKRTAKRNEELIIERDSVREKLAVAERERDEARGKLAVVTAERDVAWRKLHPGIVSMDEYDAVVTAAEEVGRKWDEAEKRSKADWQRAHEAIMDLCLMRERAEQAERERDEARHDLDNLLAIIHRDGGHYVARHTRAQAIEDAHQEWARVVQHAEAGDELNTALRDRAEAAEARVATLRAALIASCYFGHTDGCGGDRRCGSCQWLPYLADAPAGDRVIDLTVKEITDALLDDLENWTEYVDNEYAPSVRLKRTATLIPQLRAWCEKWREESGG